MSGEHLLIIFPLSEALLERAKSFGYDSVEYYPSRYVEASEHPRAIWNHEPADVPEHVWKKATVLLTMFWVASDPVLVPNLKMIQGMSAGIEHMFDPLRELMLANTALKVATASGVHSTSIAETIIMQLLNVFHKQRVLQSIQKSQKWDRTQYIPAGNLGGFHELRDHTIGILGYGCIGREVARISKCFGMHVIAATSSGERSSAKGFTLPDTGDAEGMIPERWYKTLDKEEFKAFLTAVDVLVICAPLTPTTRHLLDAISLSYLKSTAVLVNVGRGPIVDHDALIEALESDKIAGAILDVTDPEPLPPGHRLWTTKNCTISPHIAGGGMMYESRCIDLLEFNTQRLLKNQRPINTVDVLKGY